MLSDEPTMTGDELAERLRRFRMNDDPDHMADLIADAFNVPPHMVGDRPPHRYTWRLRRRIRRWLRHRW